MPRYAPLSHPRQTTARWHMGMFCCVRKHGGWSMGEGWTNAPSLSPGFWTAEPQLTRQRGPELSSDRYVLLSAVNDKSS
ncbi:hypothetical protein LA080_008538 [Diaporthe eres]|nr:hypothetical protein LA080_008538 [Diaporthe eres]